MYIFVSKTTIQVFFKKIFTKEICIVGNYIVNIDFTLG